MSTNPLIDLQREGVSVWLDFLSRDLVEGGGLARFIAEDGLRGETSNPTIFQKAITEGAVYSAAIRQLAAQGKNTEEICWQLMVEDVVAACDLFKPLYESSEHRHGYVSLEVSPLLACDPAGEVAQGMELWERVGRPNLYIKVPATPEGLPVIEELLYQGVNVNVTLLFAVSRYEEVMEAYLRALERRVAAGKPIDQVDSVASFFVSRVDTEVDKRLDALAKAHPERAAALASLKGKAAVANARLAYEAYQKIFGGERFAALRAKGARVQRPLWASTGTKNPAYSSTLYVDELIGPDCVNTMPEETLVAFRSKGTVRRTLTPETIAAGHTDLKDLAAAGIDLTDVTDHLMADAVGKFVDSYHSLLAAVSATREQQLQGA
jgi:transaldolase